MKSKNILLVSISVMVLSIAISCVCAEDKIDLRLRLEKGQSYKMQTVTDMKINLTKPGQQGQQQTMTITQKTEMRNIYTVEDVQTDGTLVLKVTYDAIVFKQENPIQNQNIEYDSADTPAAVGSPLALIFGALAGQSSTITITPDGHVKEVKGNELPEAMRAATETNLKIQYGEGTLRENMEKSFNIYSDNPVGIGDTWQKRANISQEVFPFPTLSPMIIDTIYTLKGRKDGIATIDVFAIIQSNKEAGPMEMGPMKLNYNVSGNVTGLIEMQESTGWPMRSNMTLKLSGNMATTVEKTDTSQPQSMSIPISISSTITQEPY